LLFRAAKLDDVALSFVGRRLALRLLFLLCHAGHVPLSVAQYSPGTIQGMPRTVLVAEDDPAIRELLSHHLQREGFDVLAVGDGNAALRAARELAHVLVLDIGLPAIDGLEVARTLRRERCEIPIVMLTARADEVDRIVGLELGADDYIVKPFSAREVVARVKAVLRRAGIPAEQKPSVLNFGRLEIDEAAREVRVDGCDVKLKPREFALLLTLASNPGVALSRRTLLEKVWGFDFDGDERTVDVHVRRVRLKIEEERDLPPMLQTVHGFGYKFSRS
jgi:DNA-binding response OmpR family regulator